MEPTGEALIRLLDDPDPLVYEAVTGKILQLGFELVPDLETAAKAAMTPDLHERIELIIRKLQFNQLKTDLSAWIHSPSPGLTDGAWLLTRYQFPDISPTGFSQLIKPLRQEIWLEISETLTAIEKIRIMNTLLFGKRKVRQNEDHPDSPGNNYLNRVLETGRANEHSMILLYAVIAQELELPVYVVEMKDYPILAYVDMPVIAGESLSPGFFDVLFYINPIDNGTLHSRNDITNFLIRQSLPLDPKYYEPRDNPELIRICLERLARDYRLSGSEIRFLQVQDLLALWK